MQYRMLGQTGRKVSVLGLGAMRLPEYEKDGVWQIDEDAAIPMIHHAFAHGVNYIDTAYGYCHGLSEATVGKALKGWRDQVTVSTKLPVWMVKKADDFDRLLDEQLRRLDVSSIDVYHLHALNKERWEDTVLPLHLIDKLHAAKRAGLIGHVAFSFHDSAEVMRQILDTDAFESMLCQYNLLDRTFEENMHYAATEKKMGVVVMGPVGGGRLAAPSSAFSQAFGEQAASTPELAVRFVMANPDVSVCLSGMSTEEMVSQNVAMAEIAEPLSGREKQQVAAMLEETRRLSELYCTGCNYCLPCPSGINIPRAFSLMNYHRVYGLTEHAKAEYRKFGAGTETGPGPEACVNCGACEPRCPQKIAIRRQLEETRAALEG